MKKSNKNLKNSLCIKLGIFFASLVISLIFLELGLRVTGLAVESARETEFLPPYEDRIADADYAFERFRPTRKQGRIILTLGDSLTNAGNVKSYHSYPYYLFRYFSKSKQPAAVYNMAKCEESTFGVVHKLKTYLESKPNEIPEAVIILVGAADLFNLPLVEERMKSDGAAWKEVLPGGWFYALRLYKVWRHIRMTLRLRFRFAQDEVDEGASLDERLAVLLEVYREHVKTLGANKRAPLEPALVSRIKEAFPPGETEHDDLDVSQAADFISFLADYGSVVYTPRVRYDAFFELLLDMAKSFPKDFWDPDFDTAGYYFVQTYQLQSRFTAEDVLGVMDQASADYPELLKNPSFNSFRGYVAGREEMDRFIDERRMEAWADIVRMSRQNKIRLVVQTYPVEYKSANRILKKVAAKYNLPLIDNQTHFAALIEKGERADYLEDNDHLTPAGYEILAGNVFEAFKARSEH